MRRTAAVTLFAVLAVLRPQPSPAQAPYMGGVACDGCTAPANPDDFQEALIAFNVPSGDSWPDVLFDERQFGGPNTCGAATGDATNPIWSLAPNWRQYQTSVQETHVFITTAGWVALDSGTMRDQDFGWVLPQVAGALVAHLGPDVQETPAGIDLSWTPLREQDTGPPTGRYCQLAGEFPRGLIIGYDVYRLPVAGFPAPTLRDFAANGFLAFADLALVDFNVPNPDGLGGSDRDPFDGLRLINPDGLPDTGDEILVFTDPAGLPRGTSWYRLQPIVQGDPAGFDVVGICRRSPNADRFDLDGNTTLDAVDIFRDGILEFIDPSGRGLGLTHAGEILSSPQPGLLDAVPGVPPCAAWTGGGGGGGTCATLDLSGSVTANRIGCSISLAWSSATGGVRPYAYEVYRSDTSPVPLDSAHRIATVSGLALVDSPPFGTAWTYRVVARDSCATGSQSAPNTFGDSIFVEPGDTTPPAFAGIVDTRDLGSCQVEITWDESTASDDCSGIAGYDVYRDHGVGHAGQTRIAAGVPASPYIDTTPGNGTWVYVVRAVNGAELADGNTIFQQESEGSCTNDFPHDAGMDRNGVDSPNGDHGHGFHDGGGSVGPLATRLRGSATDRLIRIQWLASLDDGGLYPVTYSVMSGTLASLHAGTYDHELMAPDACGLGVYSFEVPDPIEGVSAYYLVVAVSGDNATFGYDSSGGEIPAAPACE